MGWLRARGEQQGGEGRGDRVRPVTARRREERKMIEWN
jgi:hypothetical protein